MVGDGLAIGFAPNNYQQIASNIVNYTFCKSVSAPNEFAIFQTHNPWGATVVADAITCGEHHYEVFTPDQLAGFDFSQYRVVILNWDDTFLDEFATQYEAAIPALEAYAAAGGVVWVQGAIQGSDRGKTVTDCLLAVSRASTLVTVIPLSIRPIRWWRACPVLLRAALPVTYRIRACQLRRTSSW